MMKIILGKLSFKIQPEKLFFLLFVPFLFSTLAKVACFFGLPTFWGPLDEFLDLRIVFGGLRFGLSAFFVWNE